MELGWAFILFLFLAFVSEVLGTVGGFGSSMLFVPIAGMFLDFHSVLGLTAVFHVISNITKITLFRKGLRKDLLLQIGVPSVLAVVAGAWMSGWVNADWLEIALAVFLIVLSAMLLSGKQLFQGQTLSGRIGGGAISGLAAGLLGTGGAIRGLVLSSMQLGKDVFIATSAMIDMVIDLSRTGIYAYNGFIHQHELWMIPFLVAISVAGNLIGKSLLNRISENVFGKIVLTLVLITGLITLGKVLWG